MKALSFVKELQKDYQFCVKPFSQSLSENAPSSNSRRNLSKEQTLLMLPKLKCVKFSGVKSSKFELKNLLAQLQNCVMHLESNEVKLTLLKSYFSNYDLQLISHLTLESCNYRVAIDLFKREILNENFIINAIFNQILSYQPKYDPGYFNISQFEPKFELTLHNTKDHATLIILKNSLQGIN